MIYVLISLMVVLVSANVVLFRWLRREYDIKISYRILGWHKTHHWGAR